MVGIICPPPPLFVIVLTNLPKYVEDHMSSSVPMALDYAYGLCNGLKNTIRRKHNLGTFALFLRPDDYSDVAKA